MLHCLTLMNKEQQEVHVDNWLAPHFLESHFKVDSENFSTYPSLDFKVKMLLTSSSLREPKLQML